MSNTPVNHSTIVTPCVGVWIETAALLFPMLQVLRSHPAWVCGLKQIRYMDIQIIRVTPCVGVWIETFDFICWSKPPIVTPCVGVWIETISFAPLDNFVGSHPAWVCGLKHVCLAYFGCQIGSHPAWVCGLKRRLIEIFTDKGESHPAWVCGLKPSSGTTGGWSLCHTLRGCVDWNQQLGVSVMGRSGHTLRGCVDWNSPPCIVAFISIVTPCVGVWIETRNSVAILAHHKVTPCVGVWIETRNPPLS